MRNRAKCLNCQEVIESFHSHDYAECSCKSIYVYAGESLKCGAIEWGLFARIDDQDNIIPVKVSESIVDEKKAIHDYVEENVPNIQHLFDSLHHMSTEMERLPDQALRQYVTQYDLHRLVSLLSDIFKSI